MCRPIWEMQDRHINGQRGKIEALSWQVSLQEQAFEELHLQCSDLRRVLYSLQKQDMTSQRCTAAANVMSADVSALLK